MALTFFPLPGLVLRPARCAYAVLFLVALTGFNTAYADNTFLLQLGTSDSESQATRKWEEINAKNADVLEGATLHIAEISLPPSHKTSYRTQAGPLTSRSQANTICTALKKRGVNCYVVETAMFGSESVPQQSQAQPAPAAQTSMSETPLALGRHMAASEDTSHLNDPDYVPAPVDSGPVIISTSAPAQAAGASPAELAEMPLTPATPPAATHAPEPVAMPAPKASPLLTSRNDDEDETPAQRRLPKSFVSRNHYIKGRGPRFLDAPAETQTAAETPAVPAAPAIAAPAAAPVPAPVAAKQESPGFFGRLFGSSPPQPSDTQGVVGSVNVAEAVRVPLSGEEAPQQPRLVPVLPEVHGLGGSPEASTAKTFWAQISYFRDEAQALDFYRQFSAAYPQLSDGVRIRITRPFTATSVPSRVSLRVGPFAGTNDVGTICNVANRWRARCTVVRDLGASTALAGSASHGATVAPAQSHGLYYAQLGTYHFAQDAWDAWKELRAANKRILGRLHPSVTNPPASSANGELFRLRAGPFTSVNIASALCSRLEARGAGCAVVNDR